MSGKPISSRERAYAKNLGAWIRQVRLDLGLSQVEFGCEIGIARNTILNWEKGYAIPNVYRYSLIKRLVNKTEATQ